MKCTCQNKPGATCIEIVPIFGDLTQAEVREVAAITRERSIEKGEIIYHAGAEEKRLFVIHSGLVKISRLSPTGREQVIRLVGPGEFMGELAILNDTPLTDYAEATEPCSMCVIEGSRLKELMKRYPSIAQKILGVLSARLERAEGLIEDLTLHSPELRLAGALLDASGERSEFDLPVSKGDFASQLGMTQETLSRKLALFRDQGLIGLRGQRTIIIRDRSGLRQFAL